MMLQTVFLNVLNLSLAAALVLLLLRLLRGPFERHTTAAGRCALWCLLAVWLLLPWHLTLPGSVDVAIPDAALSATRTAALTDAAVPAAALPAVLPAAQSRSGLTVFGLLSILWLVGAAGILLWQGGSYIVLRRRLLRDTAPSDRPEMQESMETIASELGLRRPPAILLSPGAQSPMVLGFFRPVLLLPRDMEGTEDLRFVLRHELTHLRWGDLWRKLLLLAAAALHWFNPMVWLMLRRASLDLELGCDEHMLRGAGTEERAAYGRCIVDAADGRAQRHALTTPFYGGEKTMKTRVQNILHPGTPRHSTVIVALALVCALMLGNLAACTAYIPPKYADGILDMGSLFDQVQIGRRSATVRGLSSDMTAEQVLEHYGLTEEDVVSFGPNEALSGLLYVLNGNVRFRESGDYPAALQLYFKEEGLTLQRVTVSISYVGADWQTAHDDAGVLLKEIDRRLGRTVPFEEWSGEDQGWVVHEFGDSLEQLSELDTNYNRQYMYMGKKQSGFTVGMSWQDFSQTDTTTALGQDVDALFSFDINIPLYD